MYRSAMFRRSVPSLSRASAFPLQCPSIVSSTGLRGATLLFGRQGHAASSSSRTFTSSLPSDKDETASVVEDTIKTVTNVHEKPGDLLLYSLSRPSSQYIGLTVGALVAGYTGVLSYLNATGTGTDAAAPGWMIGVMGSLSGFLTAITWIDIHHTVAKMYLEADGTHVRIHQFSVFGIDKTGVRLPIPLLSESPNSRNYRFMRVGGDASAMKFDVSGVVNDKAFDQVMAGQLVGVPGDHNHPSFWYETTDPDTGKTYYYNELTQTASWVDPR